MRAAPDLSWTVPTGHYKIGIDSNAHHARLEADGQLLGRWSSETVGTSPTDCFRVGSDYWIWQPGWGGIQFTPDRPEFVAFPAPEVDPTCFDELVQRNWLPLVYQLWGRQVLHASGAVQSTGVAVALAGPSGAGKSTLAFGLARRAGWRQIADDTLAFSCEEEQVAVHAMRNEPRLRPESAAHYGASGRLSAGAWPAEGMRLGRVYFITGDPEATSSARITPIAAGEGYPLLLAQAHAFTLEIAEYNHRLMRDYLHLAARVPMYRLQYRRSFDAIDEVFDALERHIDAPDAAGQTAVGGSRLASW